MDKIIICVIITMLVIFEVVYLSKSYVKGGLFKSLKPGDKVKIMVYCLDRECIVTATIKRIVGKEARVYYERDKNAICKNTHCLVSYITKWDIIGKVEQ